jgi:hypothetical protein
MALHADELVELAAQGDARACAPLLCRELALSRSRYHELLIRLRDERAMLQVHANAEFALTKRALGQVIHGLQCGCIPISLIGFRALTFF